MSRFSRPTPLPAGVGIEGFHCGDPIVDNWTERHSATARERGAAVVYVVYCDGVVAGFYTLGTHSVARDAARGWLARNAPDQVPAVLLGMLGVDERFAGQGLGGSLLRDAIVNALKVADLTGARAILIGPTGEKAASFYAHFGFAKLSGTDRMALKLL